MLLGLIIENNLYTYIFFINDDNDDDNSNDNINITNKYGKDIGIIFTRGPSFNIIKFNPSKLDLLKSFNLS